MSEVVITSVGIVSPLGVGSEQNWESVASLRSGVRTIPELAEAGLPIPICGDIPEFDPKQYVKPRKSLKVMSRETQLGFAAAEIAWAKSGLDESQIDADRFGVINGANMFAPDTIELAQAMHACDTEGKFDFARWGTEGMAEVVPLWLLKYLPNMTPCHVGIFRDARGPTNSIVAGDTSGLLALIEAADVIRRGHADLMVAGGNSSRLALMDLMWHGNRHLTSRTDDPAAAMRPFDSGHDGYVNSEGAAMFTLESRAHAAARGATILGTILGHARRNEPAADSQLPTGQAIRQAIIAATESANIKPQDVGHVNANGISIPHDDRIEAAAIRDTLGDVPVTAPKSYFGHVGAGSGPLELAISLLALQKGLIPPTLNYETPNPECPVNVVSEMTPTTNSTVLTLNHRRTGQAAALVVDAVVSQ